MHRQSSFTATSTCNCAAFWPATGRWRLPTASRYCRSGLVVGAETEEAQAEHKSPVTSEVEHAAWGRGTVLRYEGDTLTILFDTAGYKTLALEVVVEQGLLYRAG